jgi:hypothetical protein
MSNIGQVSTVDLGQGFRIIYFFLLKNINGMLSFCHKGEVHKIYPTLSHLSHDTSQDMSNIVLFLRRHIQDSLCCMHVLYRNAYWFFKHHASSTNCRNKLIILN